MLALALALVMLASCERERVPAELDDVVDPYRRSDEVYEESFTQQLRAVRTIAQVVLGMQRCDARSTAPSVGSTSSRTRPASRGLMKRVTLQLGVLGVGGHAGEPDEVRVTRQATQKWSQNHETTRTV